MWKYQDVRSVWHLWNTLRTPRGGWSDRHLVWCLDYTNLYYNNLEISRRVFDPFLQMFFTQVSVKCLLWWLAWEWICLDRHWETKYICHVTNVSLVYTSQACWRPAVMNWCGTLVSSCFAYRIWKPDSLDFQDHYIYIYNNSWPGFCRVKSSVHSVKPVKLMVIGSLGDCFVWDCANAAVKVHYCAFSEVIWDITAEHTNLFRRCVAHKEKAEDMEYVGRPCYSY